MRLSQYFGETLRSWPSEAESPGHAFLLRANYIMQTAAGIYTLLPLGLRSLQNIATILREEMDVIGGVEISMPVVQPAELWKQTGRYDAIGSELVRFSDRADRPMVLAMTHEEVVTAIARTAIHSYRQLPALVYQIQTKFRDEARPRTGLIRVREFMMKDSYSFDIDERGLNKQYESHYHAYLRIFRRVGLPSVIAVQSDTGIMGGQLAHEFMFLTEIGEDTLAICSSCGAAANLQVATFKKTFHSVDPLPLSPLQTPKASTIEDLSKQHAIAPSQIAKSVAFVSTGASAKRQTIIAIVRGDMQVNETKLANALGITELRPAQDDEIRSVGGVPGFLSPVGLEHPKNVLVIADDLIPNMSNVVVGANQPHLHYVNANYARDFDADIVADIVDAYPGALCAECDGELLLRRGVEVGNIFKLGTRYSEKVGVSFTAQDGTRRTPIMGSYGIGLGRLLACLAEAWHDEKGLRLPISVAPFQVHLIELASKDGTSSTAASSLYAQLRAAGIDVLYDDRQASAGVKFADADLFGIPIRLTVSSKTLAARQVEVKRRDDDAVEMVDISEAPTYTQDLIRRLFEELNTEISKEPCPATA